MTAIHPVMGFINALAPNLGDPTAYTQGPLAVFGGSQALILHALKLLVRLAGCGCIGPVIGAIETFGSLILVPLAAAWKSTSGLGCHHVDGVGRPKFDFHAGSRCSSASSPWPGTGTRGRAVC